MPRVKLAAGYCIHFIGRSTHLSREVCQRSTRVHDEENPVSFVVHTNNTWKYYMEMYAMYKSIAKVDFGVGFILCSLLKVRYTYEFGNFRSKLFIVHIRDQDVKIFWNHNLRIVNVNKLTTFDSLLVLLLGEVVQWVGIRRKASSESGISWWAAEWSMVGMNVADLNRTAAGIAKSLEPLLVQEFEHGGVEGAKRKEGMLEGQYNP
jgi:hypothetical protein